MAHAPGRLAPAQRLWRLVGPERGDLAVIVVYAAGAGILGLAIPVGVQSMVNTVGFGQVLQPVIVLALLVVAGLGFAAALKAMQHFAVEVLQQRLFARAAIGLAARLPRVEVEATDRAHAPELANRFFDVLTLQKSAASLLLDAVGLVLATTIGLVVMAAYHPLLLGMGLALALLLVALLWLGGRGGVRTAIDESAAKYEVAAWLEELTRHPATFRSAAGLVLARGRAEELTRAWVAARRRHFRVVFRQVIGALGLQVVTAGALLVVGGALVLERQLTLGQLVAAELIVSAVMAGVAKSGKYLEAWYDLLAAVDKLGHLEDLEVERAGDGTAAPLGGEGMRLHLAGVRYAHEGRAVLDGLDLEVAPAERVVIVGDNGSGKSTLADLLYGARPPEDGTVDLDGVDGRDWDLDRLRAEVVLVRPGEVFAGTVTENVALGRGVSPARVRRALEAVGLWETIAALPDGLRTALTTGGRPLSDGDAARLLVARALVGRPRLVVVDGLEELDPAARAAVIAGLEGAQPRFTLVWLTRDQGLAPPGRVLTLRDGRLRAPGVAAQKQAS